MAKTVMNTPPGMEKLLLTRITNPHTLKTTWTLFCDPPSAKKLTTSSWSNNIKKVCTISSVEEFWGMYQNVPKLSEVAPMGTFHFFADNIDPEWEHSANKDGGKWAFNISLPSFTPLDEYWLNTVAYWYEYIY